MERGRGDVLANTKELVEWWGHTLSNSSDCSSNISEFHNSGFLFFFKSKYSGSLYRPSSGGGGVVLHEEGVGVIVTWMENCSTTVCEKFLQGNLKRTFHQKNFARAETCSCSSSWWKSSTCQRSWSIGWARFYFVRKFFFQGGRNQKVLLWFYCFCFDFSSKKLK